MSPTFDTIRRDKLLEITEENSSEDVARVLKVILKDTRIKIKIKGAITTPFTSKIQTQQGDSYSGPQLELYFENSLRKVRKESGILNQKDLSEEMIYDDDFDNLTEDLEKKRKFKEILGNY